MIDLFYRVLASLGYSHPVHVMVTHMPIGLVTGSLALLAVALIWKKRQLEGSARHVFVLALIFAVPTVIAGFMDWIHFYNGAWIFAIKMKILLAAVLLVLLVVGVVFGARGKGGSPIMLVIYVLSFFAVVGLGYFGGNLVFGEPVAAGEPAPAPRAVSASPTEIQAGSAVFASSCQGCHPRGGNVVDATLPLKSSKVLESPQRFVDFIRDPKRPDGKAGDMPAFDPKEIGDAEAGGLYAYIVDTVNKGGWR